MNIKKVTLFIATVCSLSLGLISMARATQTGDSLVYQFEGYFSLSTPCKINNDQVMNIPFGSVGVNKVDGANYLQTIPYNVDCQGSTDSSPVKLTVTGTVTSYDAAAIPTSAEGLGIQIRANGQPMNINQALETTMGALQTLTLQAVPVKDPAKQLTAQEFNAVATLKADYQ